MDNSDSEPGYRVSTLGWLSGAWRLFSTNPKVWLLSGLLMLIAFITALSLSWLGQLALSLLSPVLMGSLMLGAAKQQRGGSFELSDLAAAFRDTSLFKRLALLGCFLLVLNLVLMQLSRGLLIVLGYEFDGTPMSLKELMEQGRADEAMRVLGPLAIVSTISLVIYGMSVMFSIPHVVFGQAEPFTAILASITGCLRYFGTVLGCGVLFFIASLVVLMLFRALLPLGFALVIILLWPISVCLQYVAYISVFQPGNGGGKNAPEDSSFNA